MPTTPNINQFAQTPVDGQPDLSFQGSVISARVANSQVVPLVAGQAVAGDTTAPGTSQDGVPPVISLASDAVPCIGFVVRNMKDQNFPANSRLELAMDNTAIYKTTNSTVTRFSPVEYNNASGCVIAWGGVNPICGYALDAAINSGDLIRILVRNPQLSASNTSQSPKTITVVATLAQINAGLTVIPGVAGKKITVTNFIERVAGAFATGTAVALQSTNGTPVVVESTAEAGLTNGAVLVPASANVTLGAGFGIALGTGDGLAVANSGSAQTGGTSITYTITYTQA